MIRKVVRLTTMLICLLAFSLLVSACGPRRYNITHPGNESVFTKESALAFLQEMEKTAIYRNCPKCGFTGQHVMLEDMDGYPRKFRYSAVYVTLYHYTVADQGGVDIKPLCTSSCLFDLFNSVVHLNQAAYSSLTHNEVIFDDFDIAEKFSQALIVLGATPCEKDI